MDELKVLRIACIGAGSISREFSLRYLNSSPHLEVCAVVDLDMAAAQSLAFDVAYRRAGASIIGEKYRETVDQNSISEDTKKRLPSVIAATNIDDILKDVDCVYIGTPPLSHAELTIKALASQKHVILEKPLAVSMEDCDAIVQAAEDAYRLNGLIVNINIGMRHNKALHELKERVYSPTFGQISRITLKNHYMQWPRVWQVQPWVAQRAQGGPLLEVGTHWIFGLLELMGHDSYVSSTAVTEYPDDEANDSCERSCRATISLRNGVNVEMDIKCESDDAIAVGKDIYELTVNGSRSHGVSAMPSYTLYDFTKLRDNNSGIDIVPFGTYGRMECVDEFVKAILKGTSTSSSCCDDAPANLVTPLQARNVQAIIMDLKSTS